MRLLKAIELAEREVEEHGRGADLAFLWRELGLRRPKLAMRPAAAAA